MLAEIARARRARHRDRHHAPRHRPRDPVRAARSSTRSSPRSHRHDPGAPVLPYLLSGGTDNKALSLLGITGYGFAPLQAAGRAGLPGDVPRRRRAGAARRISVWQAGSRPTCCSDLLDQRKHHQRGFHQRHHPRTRPGPHRVPADLLERPPAASSGQFLGTGEDPGRRSPRSPRSAPRLAVVIFFWRDIVRIIGRGASRSSARFRATTPTPAWAG